ncbi:MAG: hypothetical protein ACRD8O_15365, partial [Bryobacteraceae bacterium]
RGAGIRACRAGTCPGAWWGRLQSAHRLRLHLRPLPFFLPALALCLHAAIGPSRAEVIDRIAVTTGAGVITDSEIRREIRIVAFLNNEPPGLGPGSRRKTAERLVDQRLMRREMDVTGYVSLSANGSSEMLAELIAERFDGDAARYKAAVQQAGLREPDLKSHFERQSAVLRFVSVRFRPGVQVSAAEIEDYFKKNVAPKLPVNPHPPMLDDDQRAGIEETIIEERVNQLADAWLKDARTRTRIEFREEAFK